MRWIYLSPHLDDAILSCGGIIAEQRRTKISVEIWNVMSGIPEPNMPISDLARSVHAEWGLATAKEGMDFRLAEDRLAAKRLDAVSRYFNFLDCIYRHDEKGEALYTADIFVPPHKADTPLIDEIAIILKENLQDDDMLICPLGVGKHPDHIIVRCAAEKIERPLRYYGDIPYIFRHPEQFAEIAEGLDEEQYPVSEEALQIWQDAAAAYGSQLEVLFGGEEKMRSAFKSLENFYYYS